MREYFSFIFGSQIIKQFLDGFQSFYSHLNLHQCLFFWSQNCHTRSSLACIWSWDKLYEGYSSVQFSRSVVSNSLRPHELQHARPPCPSPPPGVHPNSCPSSRWCHPASHPLSSPSPPAPNPSEHQSLFQWVNSLHEVAKVLEFQL